MTQSFGDVDYDQEQRLYAGRKTTGAVPSEVLLLDCPPDPLADEEEAKAVVEARLVAHRVLRLLREERVPEGETTRAARPEDVAILLSSFTNKAPIFRAELQKLGIPCGAGGGAFFGTVETAVLLSLLRLLQNRRQDIPLASVLRSPLYGFTPDRLALLRSGRESDSQSCYQCSQPSHRLSSVSFSIASMAGIVCVSSRKRFFLPLLDS